MIPASLLVHTWQEHYYTDLLKEAGIVYSIEPGPQQDTIAILFDAESHEQIQQIGITAGKQIRQAMKVLTEMDPNATFH